MSASRCDARVIHGDVLTAEASPVGQCSAAAATWAFPSPASCFLSRLRTLRPLA